MGQQIEFSVRISACDEDRLRLSSLILNNLKSRYFGNVHKKIRRM